MRTGAQVSDDPLQSIQRVRSELLRALTELDAIEARQRELLALCSQPARAPNAPEPLLNQTQLAERLGLGRNTLSRWAKDGIISPVVSEGHTRLYLLSEVIAQSRRKRVQAVNSSHPMEEVG